MLHITRYITGPTWVNDRLPEQLRKKREKNSNACVYVFWIAWPGNLSLVKKTVCVSICPCKWKPHKSTQVCDGGDTTLKWIHYILCLGVDSHVYSFHRV